MIDEYTIGGSNSETRLVTMSHSSRRKGDIWKKPPRKTATSSSATSAIRRSDSFVEKMLRDCLKPRNYRRISGNDRKRLGIPTSQSDQGTNTESFEYIPAEDYSYITPPRKSRDSRHDPPGYSREIPESARTLPPLNPSLRSWDLETIGDSTRMNAMRSTYLPLSDHLSVAGASRRLPVRHPYLSSQGFENGVHSTRTVTPSTRQSHPRDYGSVANEIRSVTPRQANNSDDFGIIGIASPRRYSRHQPKQKDRIKPKTPHHSRVKRERFHQHRENPSNSQPSSFSCSFSSFQEEREQALRDYKVTIEYKHLKSHAPGGVYLIPSMDSLRNFHGIIFVRRGPFTNGIFKFRLDLPAKYNDTNMHPKITFSSKVYNPYVDEKTGELDVKTAYPTWDPSRHYLVTVLTFLKKIFYSKTFTDAKANPAARQLFEKDPAAYKKKVEACVHESQKKVYVNEKGSTAKFTEEEVAHRVLRDLLKHHIRNEKQVTKQTILAQVEKSRKV